MDELPAELLVAIAARIRHVRDLLSFACSNRRLCALLTDTAELEEAVWRPHVERAVGGKPLCGQPASHRAACRQIVSYGGPRFPGSALRLCSSESQLLLLSNSEARGTAEFVIEKLVPAAFLGLGIATSASRQILGDTHSGGLYNRGFFGFHSELEECDLSFAEGDRVAVTLADSRLEFRVNGGPLFCPYYGIPPRTYYFAIHYQTDWNHQDAVRISINPFR
jgi:hypothetical protein